MVFYFLPNQNRLIIHQLAHNYAMQLNNSANLNVDRRSASPQKSDDLAPENSKKPSLSKTAPQADTVQKEKLSPKGKYLKMISRLENKIKNEKISPGMLKETFSALEDRLNDLTPKQQKKFLELQLFKKKGIEDLDNISELFVEMSEQEGTRSELFELLKNQEFISLLMSEPLTPEKYSSTLFNQNGTDLAVV
jgi:hypothetical protein